ncbi:MAG: hypothetical protein GTN98_15440 [Woeseiaceae bacterium]|nr:hypothetical protein [Woeseiaceae bacterium]
MLDLSFRIPQKARLVVLAITPLAILGLVNSQIMSKEAIVADGHVVLLRLAPRDPRSLLQGDYMALRYRIAEEVASAARDAQLSDGVVVIRLDEDRVAAFEAIYDGQQLMANQLLLRFRKRGDSVRLASDAFFFEEGEWPTYQGAVYGELAVNDDGEAVLTGLRGGDRQKLGPVPDQ